LVRSGIITPNEARAAEGLDPMEGGDELQAQAVGGRPPDGQGDGQDALPPGRITGPLRALETPE
jgi:hypothetical protein